MTSPRASALLGLLLVLGCGGSSAPAANSSPGGSGGEELASTTTDSSTPDEIELLDAGGEPREVLRYHYTAGASTRAVVSMEMGTETRVNDVPVPGAILPIMRMTLQEGPYEALGGDRFAAAARILEATALPRAGVMPEVLTAVDGALAPLLDLEGRYVIDTRGNSLTEDWTFRPGVTVTAEAESMRQDMLEDAKYSVPLPLEAVGIGARWRTKQMREAGGMLMRQSMTFTLVRRDGHEIELEGVVTQTAQPQDVTLDGGVRARLMALSGDGQANSVIDLRTLAVTSAVTVDTRVDMQLDGSHVHSEASLRIRLEQGPTQAE